MTTRSGPYGVYLGDEFDDGVNDDVRKVIIGEDSYGVVYLKIDYVNNGNVVSQEHGRNIETQITENDLELEYPDEYITSIRGTYGYIDNSNPSSDASTSQKLVLTNDALSEQMRNLSITRESYLQVLELQFWTSYGRKFGEIGKRCSREGSYRREFKLEGEEGMKLVGLHGRSSGLLYSLGADFALVSSVFKRVKPYDYGVSLGVCWDDGVYDGLKKVCVGEDSDGLISFVAFEYAKGEQSITHSHGKKPHETKQFLLDYENGEYIKSVEGTYDTHGFVSSLTFITSINKDIEIFGKPVGKKFVIEAKGFDKLVGFRGRSSLDRLNALGANFAVVLDPPVQKLEAQGDIE